MAIVVKKVFIEISPETVFQHFNDDSDWQKANYLHSVSIARCYRFVKRHVCTHMVKTNVAVTGVGLKNILYLF